MKQLNHIQQTPQIPTNTGLPANNSNQMKLFGDMAQFLVAVAAASNNSSTVNNQPNMSTKCPKSANSLPSPNANLFNSIPSFQFPTNHISTVTPSALTTASLSPNSINSQAAALAAAYKYTSSLYNNLQQHQNQMTSGTASASDLLANLSAQKEQMQQSYTASLMKYMSYYYSNGSMSNASPANKSLEYVQRLLAEKQANSVQSQMENQMLIDCNNGSSFQFSNQIPANISPISHKSSQHHGKQNQRFHPYSKGSIDSLNKFESNKSNISKKAHMAEKFSPSSPTSPCSAFSSTTSNHIGVFKSTMKKQHNYLHLEQQQQKQCNSSPTSRSTTPISPNTTIDSASIHMSNDGSIDASRVLTADDQ